MIEEREQTPRHTITYGVYGPPHDEDYDMQLHCPFGSDTYVSDYPTVLDAFDEELHIDSEGFPRPQHGWIPHVGHMVEGYCTMNSWTRPIYRYRTRGCVIEVQHIASGSCLIEFEASQVGLEEMVDNEVYLEGTYPVTFGSDGSGEDYQCWLAVEYWARVPPPGE